MTGFEVAVAGSVFSFVRVLLVMTLVLGFWGRLVIRCCRTGSLPKYGQTISTTAGAALVVFCGLAAAGFSDNIKVLMTAFYYLGLGGFVLEVLFRFIPGFIKSPAKKELLLTAVQGHRALITVVILGLVLSFFHSVLGENGRIEIWLYGSADLYNWIMISDYWLGAVRPEAFDMTGNFYRLTMDSFGTHVLLGLTSLAMGASSLLAAPIYMLVLIAWSAASIRSLAQAFGLGFWSAILVALGVSGGAFYTYLYYIGEIGQFTAMMAFLAALEMLFRPGETARPPIEAKATAQRAKTLVISRYISYFIPIFLLLVCYQGGFFAFITVWGLAAAALKFFQSRAGSWPVRTVRALWLGIKYSFLLTLVAALVAPYEGVHLIERSLETASQTTGWLLPFISPWLLVGLPIYWPKLLIENSLGPASYITFLTSIILLAIFVLRRSPDSREAQGDQRAGSRPVQDDSAAAGLTAAYIISLIIYAAAFIILRNSYLLWKFVSFTALPLSFVPLSLVLAAIKRLRVIGHKFLGLARVSLAMALLMIGIDLSSVISDQEFMNQICRIKPAASFLSKVKEFIHSLPPETWLIFDYTENSQIYLTAEHFKNQSAKKFFIFGNHYIFKNTIALENVIQAHRNFLLITDKEYKNLYFNENKSVYKSRLLIIKQEKIDEDGYVTYYGIKDQLVLDILEDWVSLKVKVPEKYDRRPVELKVTLVPSPRNYHTCLASASLAFHTGQPLVWLPGAGLKVTAPVPPDLPGQSRTFKASVRLEKTTLFSDEPCLFWVDSTELSVKPAEAGAGDELKN
ncbi:MAG: hypothetical protein LBT47_06190 [Deltaproteobacteria bacterium]|jgi:hypothetical protein|nr:hypothetical protein [Deltaproteobacteria bacterium]